MRTTPALLASLCLLGVSALSFGGCGSAEESTTEQSADEFRHGRWNRECMRAFGECAVSACGSEIDQLRRARPFGRAWFTAFVHTKICAFTKCGSVCSHGGTGGSGGGAGTGGQPGTGGSAGTGSVCNLSANACQSCVCKPCESQVAICNADSACRNVVTCGMAQSCSGVDCYFKADGTRGPCADQIDDAGGPAGASVAKALDVLRCTEEARSTCSACSN